MFEFRFALKREDEVSRRGCLVCQLFVCLQGNLFPLFEQLQYTLGISELRSMDRHAITKKVEFFFPS